MFFPDAALAAREFPRVAKLHARVCAAVSSGTNKNAWAAIAIGSAFVETGLRDIEEQQVSTVHSSRDSGAVLAVHDRIRRARRCWARQVRRSHP